jgi:hypothetical protein
VENVSGPVKPAKLAELERERAFPGAEIFRISFERKDATFEYVRRKAQWKIV